MINDEFADIRPYYDTEISDAMHRIASDPLLEHVANYLMPNKPIEEVQALFRSLCSIDDFQRNIMYHAVKTIERNSTFGLEVMGFEQLTPGECYLFVSNHRDIVLDSAFLQAAMYDNGRPTTEITFGSNLMKPQFVVDFGKSNKMFKVTRSSSMREFLINSMHHSRYMRTKLANKEESSP